MIRDEEFAPARWPSRPILERLGQGDAVFLRGVIDNHSGVVSLMQGEVYLNVMKRAASGMAEVGSVAVSCVTRADAYLPADRVRYAEARAERAEALLKLVSECLDGVDPVGTIRAALEPPSEDED